MTFVLIFLINSFLYCENKFDYNDINRIEFVSDYALYDSSGSLILLSSNVVINSVNENNKVDLKIKTEKVEINTSSSVIVLNSSFTLDTSSMSIKADNGDFNFEENYGLFDNAISRYDRFVIKGKKVVFDKDKYIYKNAVITTCDEDPPHYRVSSQRLSFVPHKYFLSYNNIFYIGKVPILYFPVFYKPLGGGTPIISQFYPGYDSRNGFYIKSNYTYKFSSYSKMKLFVDYFSRKGWGFGGEFYKYKKDSVKFNLSYYRIDERGAGPIEWGANGGLWAKIYDKDGKELYVQNYIRLMSAPSFNNNYFRSNPFAISADKQWENSLTYRMSGSYLRVLNRVVYKSLDDYSFKEYQNISPKAEYQMITRRISNLPINHELYVSAENSRTAPEYFGKKMNLSYTLSNSLNILRDFSFYNSINYSGNIAFQNASNSEDVLISRYRYNSGFRYSTLSNSYEIGYFGLFRSKKNKAEIDFNSQDKGIEKSLLNLDITLFSQIDRYMRFHADYDLKPYDEGRNFKRRLGPLSLDYYKSFYNYEVYVKEVYDINDGHKSFITQLNSNYEKNYLNIGFANYSSNKDRFLISNTLGYYPSRKGGWYGEFVLRYYVDFNKDMGVKFFEKGFNLNKEFHDFRAKFALRNRKKVNEVFFYITMKMNDPYRKNEIDREVDEFFKPWRKFDEERDY